MTHSKMNEFYLAGVVISATKNLQPSPPLFTSLDKIADTETQQRRPISPLPPPPGLGPLWHQVPWYAFGLRAFGRQQGRGRWWPGRMWFKINRRKLGDVRRQAFTPLRWGKSKKGVKRFHWPSLRNSSFRQKSSLRRASPSRVGAGVPPLMSTSIIANPASPPPRRIRCGTTVIPIMRASALHFPPPTAVKRRPAAASSVSSLEHKFLKLRRLSRCLEHFNPIYDDVYNDSSEEMEEEAIYEEITPPRRRELVAPSYLDLMQVSAVVTGSPSKHLRSVSPTSSQGVYVLHGGDWVSVASGVYDDVASSDNESVEEFDAGIYGWTHDATNGARIIPWPTAAYGESAFVEDPSALQWMHRESYIIQ
ncbi:hypothetical protein TcWFU_000946 [Taenia crassiceps]|uniref:Uncharacterized protein n=1 Tax=Taenia crassiceps TaxID=6207 RepID=A0ABR4QJF1_9CEST